MSFTLYNSSAGSGKTYTLVIEYLSIVLKNPSKFNKVLAITFTNKAATEMKERIIRYLVKISKGEMREVIEKILNEDNSNLNKDKLIKNANTLLKKILHKYSDFAVMTIDSFIYRVVSAFSLELDLPLNFEVDLNTTKIISTTVNSMIENTDSINYTGKIIKDFIMSKIQESDSWNYENEIEDIGKELFSEKSIEFIETLSKINENELLEILKELKDKKFRFEKKIKNLAKEAVKIIEKSGLDVSDFKNGQRGIAGVFNKLANAEKSEDFDLKKRFTEGKHSEWATIDSPNSQLIKKLVNDNLEALRYKIVSYHEKNIRLYSTLLTVLKSFSLTALIRELNLLVDEYKKKHNIVPISDFNKIVSKIIKEEIIPFIYWRVGDKFENYLLDEFQDTSSMQLHNLFPLIENSYSAGFKNISVGDPKQSIYRWRSSNPEIMGSEIRALVDKSFFNYKRLEYNFRSSKNIIDFNNGFFSDIYDEFELKDILDSDNIYSKENVIQKTTAETDDNGYIEIFTMKDKIKKTEFINISVEYTINTIKDILEEGFSLKDIAILTRTNSEGSLIAEELFKSEINVISQDSLFLNSSLEVRFIISALKFSLYSENLNLLEMIRALKPELFNNILINPNNREKYFKDFKSEYPKFFIAVREAESTSLYERVEDIIRIFNLNEKNGGYIQGLLEIVFNFEQKSQSDLLSFFDFWEEKKNSEECALKIPSGINAVSIMTIHKSKGLEFPIVIIPFANWKVLPSSTGFKKSSIWAMDKGNLVQEHIPYLIELKTKLSETFFSEEFELERINTLTDNLNLLYVAFTRAKDRLYLSINPTNNDNISQIIKKRLKKLKIHLNKNLYTYGQKKKYSHKSINMANSDKTEIFETFNSVPWTDKLTIRKRAMDIWGDEGVLTDSSRTEKIRKGNIIHKILSNIVYIEDRENALSKALYTGNVSKTELKEIDKEIETILNLDFEDGKIKKLFSKPNKIYCEKEILSEKGKFKPDRIIIRENDTVIIEYKTGNKREKDIKQVKDYIDLTEKCGYKNVSAYIIYIKDKEIIRVKL